MTTGKYGKAGPPPRAHGRDKAGKRGVEPPLPVHWVSNRVRIGLHGRNDTDYQELDYRIIREAKIETLKTMSQTKLEVYKRLRDEHPNLEFIVRLYDESFGVDHHPSAAEFAGRMAPLIKSLRPYATKFEIHNEPNHQDRIEGWGPTVDQARSFNKWFLDVFQALKQECPWAELGFPGLALHHGGYTGDLDWLEACREAVNAADWLGVHCYWQQDNHLSFDWGFWFREYHTRFPQKKLDITEFGNSTPNFSRDVVAQQYGAYFDALQPYGGYLRSACAYMATSPDPTWDLFCWGKVSDGQCYPVVAKVGNLSRTELVAEDPLDKLAGVKDWRGQLPTRKTDPPYGKRDVKGITTLVIHHSAQSPSWTANAGGNTGHGIAGYDVRQTDKVDAYPEITYHFVVTADGVIERCHSLDVLAWHAGARGMPAPGGVGIYNWQAIGICLAGSFMAGKRPPSAQIEATARLCNALLEILPKAEVKGHRELLKALTACPGDTWLSAGGYKEELLALVPPPGPRPYAYKLDCIWPHMPLFAGGGFSTPVVVTNLGTKPWLARGERAVRVAYRWADAAGKVLTKDWVRTDLPADVAPKSKVTITAPLEFPAEPGAYLLQWNLVEGSATWFSEQGAAMVQMPITVQARPPKPYAYRLTYQAPETLNCGDTIAIPVTLTNTSGQTWRAGGARPVHLSYHWADPSGKRLISEGERTDLPADVPPGGETTLQAKVKAPDDPGDYLLQWDLVEETVTWFSEQGAPVVTMPVTAQKPLPRKWAVTASIAAADAFKAADGKLDTAWCTPEPQSSGQWFRVDLGSVQLVRSFRASSPAGQHPRGYVISTSLDGESWQEATRQTDGRGDMDVTFAPRKARYLRAELLLPSWAITELAVGAEPIVTWKATASNTPADAAKAIDGNPATAWSTGQGQASGMWFQIDLGDLQRLTRITAESPKKEQTPRGYKVSLSPDGQTWTEIAAKSPNYTAVDLRLGVTQPIPVARYVRIELTADDRYKNAWAISEVTVDAAPLWTAEASHNSGEAGKAVDNNPLTTWSSGLPQAPGMWLTVDLGRALKVNKIVLDSGEREFPRGLAVSLSTDGQTWQEAGRIERFYRTPVTVKVEATPARYLRIEQTSDAVQAARWSIPWSISDLKVFLGPEA